MRPSESQRLGTITTGLNLSDPNAFVNKFLLGQDTNTNIAIAPNTAPSTAGQATFDLDQTKGHRLDHPDPAVS
jgi:hypothetical protein